ncbi:MULTISPECIES: UDP-glucose 4-epimerase GalE [Thalassospira]|uniref:UDP-glucose 4-epimerase n=2 Tax=Thalassospira TaxID=168934 RepID=A0A367VZR4_9PROT|nr:MULTISPECIES: UDP-glucose 4-epimerase GalE [Thalassospira]MDG4720125.1 UDP-glucose 4-epimerase GalE [Thalassospira sp. FZY0004]RCK31757.1 UDP-galactose-4-epimerase [Thalassospira profundimaris]
MTTSKGTILLTGGLGYIGSHTAITLIENGYEVVIVDNLSNSSLSTLGRIEKILSKKITFFKSSIDDKKTLDNIFTNIEIDAVIHFSAFKSVTESVQNPLEYYKNNVSNFIDFLKICDEHGMNRIIYSSSATVYSPNASSPITEDAATGPVNPYGNTKLCGEMILRDLCSEQSNWQVGILRYFNPAGAHESALIGESPRGTPNNLMPYIADVAIGKRNHLNIYGDDYPTVDGTGVRDYIHVMDLAEGHLATLEYLLHTKESVTLNLGTGTGTSVLQLVKTYENASGYKIPYHMTDRRPGDIAACYADPERAKRLLGWKAKRSIHDMCLSSWKWISQKTEYQRSESE